MTELLRSNDLVLLSFIQALLASENIKYVNLDEHINAVDGNIAAFPRRLMVDDAQAAQARMLLRDADLGHVLSNE